MKVVVAMSGGVDSSVAAATLKKEGCDVVGVSLHLHDMAAEKKSKFGTCCSLSDIADARRVAQKLNIPFYVSDMEKDFRVSVIDDFVAEYERGRTPNPCVRCNQKVKFRTLMDWATDLGADFLATGHYAQTKVESGKTELLKGSDPDKDQSYFLFAVEASDLKRTLFPVGGFSKSKVRVMAREFELAVAEKPDSQEICFVPSNNYKDFVRPHLEKPFEKGAIRHMDGRILGEHTGLYQFTIGQRKGLGSFSSDPLFVISMDSNNQEVTVGPEKNLFKNTCRVSNPHWIHNEPLPKDFTAKIRYRAPEANVSVSQLSQSELEVHFEKPQRAVTPGQAIVFYEGNRVAGGGWIENAKSHAH